MIFFSIIVYYAVFKPVVIVINSNISILLLFTV